MTDYLIVGIEILVIILVFGMGTLGCLGLWRKIKGVPIDLMKDYRNPSRRPTSYYGMVDKADSSIKLYARSIDFQPVRKIPLFDLSAWKDSKGRVKGVIGVTGRPGDEMFVPYGTALLSQAAANEYARMVSDSVTNMQSLFEKCTQMDLRVGEPAQLEIRRGKNIEKLKGTISRIDYKGVTFSYLNSPTPKSILLTVDDLDELKAFMTPEQKQKLKPLGYSNFFTEDWVMEKFGIRRVENASIMTVAQKQTIANSINSNNEFVNDGKSWIEKHIGLVSWLLLLLFVGVMFMFGFYGLNTYQQGTNSELATLAASLGLHAPAGTTTNVVGSTTTIPTVNVGGTQLPT